ncbi:MAG: hypothetical protein KDA21_13105 [Phycisphaerales bacterium]|nr:hypothetical protein [Phycisphaerales bacterium]
MNRSDRCAAGVSAGALMVVLMTGAAFANPWADEVMAYVPGNGVIPGYDDAGAALGEPTRFTAPESPFGGGVTPFQSAFGAGELVTVGEGGSLTVRFAEPVTDDASNPWGIDLLIFGNAGYLDADYPNGMTTSPAVLFGVGGMVEVSADGVEWRMVVGAEADAGFPTLGYRDTTEAFPVAAGSRPTDFTRPVNPNFDASGLSIGEIVDAYNGSGGGTGIDLASVGLSAISYVRITNPLGSGVTPEIDGFADVSVPGPGALALLAWCGVAAGRRRR